MTVTKRLSQYRFYKSSSDPKKDKRQKQKLSEELNKTRLNRLKLSQKVPLAIRDVQAGGTIHHFMLSSEYERTVWSEAINEGIITCT